MADAHLVCSDDRLRLANVIALTTAAVLLNTLSIVVVPLLAHLCRVVLGAFDAEMPRLANYIVGIPYWGAIVIAIVGTAVLFAKDCLIQDSTHSLWANVSSCIAIIICGSVCTVALTLPIHMLMQAMPSLP